MPRLFLRPCYLLLVSDLHARNLFAMAWLRFNWCASCVCCLPCHLYRPAGVIRKGDLATGMTNLAMLSPSTRALHHGRKERPIRTHEIVLTDASTTVTGTGTGAGGSAGRARTGTGGAAAGAGAEGDSHHAGFSASGGDAAGASAVAPEAEAFSLATAATGGSAGRLTAGSRRASATAGAAPAGGAAAAPERRVVPASALEFLTQERWAELDWDANGEISFREWVHAFLSWAEVDEEEDDDVEAEGAAGEGAGEDGAGGGSVDSLTALGGAAAAAAAAIEADNRAVKSVDGVKLTLLTAE